jgi:hypothetical protein
MIYIGINWRNLGYAGGNAEHPCRTYELFILTFNMLTSYDYGASTTENRELYREIYSELKIEANILESFARISHGLRC